jgi:hypothetical protein
LNKTSGSKEKERKSPPPRPPSSPQSGTYQKIADWLSSTQQKEKRKKKSGMKNKRKLGVSSLGGR